MFGVGGVLRDRSPFDQGDRNPLHSQPLFTGSTPEAAKEQRQLGIVMGDPGSYIQSAQYPFNDQSLFAEPFYGQEAQAQQNNLAELLLLDQGAFEQATQLNQLDAQHTGMSSPHIDLLAEFTNDMGA